MEYHTASKKHKDPRLKGQSSEANGAGAGVSITGFYKAAGLRMLPESGGSTNQPDRDGKGEYPRCEQEPNGNVRPEKRNNSNKFSGWAQQENGKTEKPSGLLGSRTTENFHYEHQALEVDSYVLGASATPKGDLILCYWVMCYWRVIVDEDFITVLQDFV